MIKRVNYPYIVKVNECEYSIWILKKGTKLEHKSKWSNVLIN